MAHLKDVEKLRRRNAVDFADLHSAQLKRAGITVEAAAATPEEHPALLRLKALTETVPQLGAPTAPVDPTRPNWVPVGPLAVPGGQSYGGARILISGRVTAIAPHPTNANRIFIGSSRGGIWRTDDGASTWIPLGDNQPSLAIGALAVAQSNPDVLYAGTGEGNVQLYSTIYPTSSAPGVYLGVGVLRSIDGGTNWTHHAATLLAGHSFYRIAVDPTSANQAFAATSIGLCRTMDGVTWTAITGGGLPAISGTVIACTDVIIDRSDNTGNTIYVAFFHGGIFKSTNALAANPTFAALTTGLPAVNATGRISLHQSASSTARRYALIASSTDEFLGLYRTTTAAGTDWELCTNDSTIQVYGAFTSNVAVDPTTPDVAYVSGVELYKCVRSAAGTWSVTNVGHAIHADSHAFSFHPTNNQVIYSGNDGGFYISRDGGQTWDDNPNEGLCLLQYEAIDNHGTSDALVQGGSQDNGTQQFRNGPVHYHSADGDGGYCVISKLNGNNVTHAYYGNSPERSTAGGMFGTYSNIAAGINGNGLFYPPAAISPTSERVAWGTESINIDNSEGTGGWPVDVSLSGIAAGEEISAISFTSDTLIYCATTRGKVYRLDLSGGTWSARALQAAPLPAGQWIWDVQSLPGNSNVVIVAFSGFGLTQHVWRGTVPTSGAATWAAVSGGLPDVPMCALALSSATEWYLGSDIGVFRTTNAGTTWIIYSQGLPNTAIYDLRQRSGSSILRAATHGRGLWEINLTGGAQPMVDIFVRDNIMDMARGSTSAMVPAAWEDPTRHVLLNDPCYWWHCADIKTDAPPSFQLPASDTNYLDFETKLVHEDPEKGNLNRIYVQVHNRGPLPANNVTVKIMVAGASAGLPNLPADFWSAWPNSTGDAHWTAVGSPQTIASLPPLRPEVLRWDWTPAASADTHTCMLVVIDSPSDPVPASSKAIFNIAQLVTSEKRVGLKNLHLVNLLPSIIKPLSFHFYAAAELPGRYIVRIPRLVSPVLSVGFLLSQTVSGHLGDSLPEGLTVAPLHASDVDAIKKRWLVDEGRSGESWDIFVRTYDTRRQFGVAKGMRELDLPVTIEPGSEERIVLLVRTGDLSHASPTARLGAMTVLQTTERGQVVGGSTFIFRQTRSG